MRERAGWTKRIVAIDSGSTDHTLALLAEQTAVTGHRRRFDTHTCRWNCCLEKVSIPWVLSLDADNLILPLQLILFRTAIGRYVDEGHTRSLVVKGTRCHRCAPILHVALEAGTLLAGSRLSAVWRRWRPGGSLCSAFRAGVCWMAGRAGSTPCSG